MPEVPEVPWGHRVGLMSLLMIHKAYMPVYSDPDFSCGTNGRTDQPKVVQEVLADLKTLFGLPLFFFLFLTKLSSIFIDIDDETVGWIC